MYASSVLEVAETRLCDAYIHAPEEETAVSANAPPTDPTTEKMQRPTQDAASATVTEGTIPRKPDISNRTEPVIDPIVTKERADFTADAAKAASPMDTVEVCSNVELGPRPLSKKGVRKVKKKERRREVAADPQPEFSMPPSRPSSPCSADTGSFAAKWACELILDVS